MKLKKNIGKLEIKALGVVLTQASSEEQIASALKHAPHIAIHIEGATKTKAKD